MTGDVQPVIKLYLGGDSEPAVYESIAATKILREQGYPLPTDVLVMLTRDFNVDQRVQAWVRLPKELRPPIDAYMTKRYPLKGINRRNLVLAAAAAFLKPPAKSEVEAKAFYDLALWFGKDTGVLNFELARQWIVAGKRDEGTQLIASLLREHPTDSALPQRAAVALISVGDYAGTTAIYRQALAVVPEPYTRAIRRDYAGYLRGLAERHPEMTAPDSLNTLEQQPDALLAGEAWLSDGKFPAAAACFRVQFADTAAPVERRLAAWDGLLDSDPAGALAGGEALCRLLEQLDPAARAPLLRWCGWMVHRALGEEIPPDPRVHRLAAPWPARPLHDTPGWEGKVASLLTRLIAIDHDAFLQPDPRDYNTSLRATAAAGYALNQQGEAAYLALMCPLNYDVPPPPGGWTIFDGSPDKNADQPRRHLSPTPREMEKDLGELRDELARYQWATMRDNQPTGIGLPLSVAAAHHLSDELAAEQDPALLTAKVKCLGIAVSMATMALDPTPEIQHADRPAPPIRPVELAQFSPIDQAIRAAVKNDAVALHAKPLLEDGLLASLTTASNPQFTDALFALLTATFDRYAEVEPHKSYVSFEADRLAAALAIRPIYDMKPYAQRLRDKYPKAK